MSDMVNCVSPFLIDEMISLKFRACVHYYHHCENSGFRIDGHGTSSFLSHRQNEHHTNLIFLCVCMFSKFRVMLLHIVTFYIAIFNLLDGKMISAICFF